MPGFVKEYSDRAAARCCARRSAALRQQDVPTPVARPGADPRAIEFDHLGGETGLSLVSPQLGTLLEPVMRLHGCTVAGLRPFDPLRRIRPCLHLATRPEIKAVLGEPVPRGSATLHGDLHAAQFIRDHAGKVWIVDLDDLALGPPEADIANFAAHLATSLPGAIAVWASRVCRAWTDLSGSCDAGVFQRHLRFALVLRHLKLREARRPDFETEVLAYLRDSSNFSIR